MPTPERVPPGLRPDESERARHEIAFGRQLAEADPELVWGWGTPAGQQRARRRAALIVAGAGLSPGMTVLEIGCGTGLFTERFAATGARIVAIDISADLLTLARARGLAPDRVSFLERRVEDCRLEDPALRDVAPEGFDAVIGSSVLHHLDLVKALDSIRQVLRPSGLLSFAEPNLLNPQVLLERKMRWLFRNVSDDEWAVVRWRLQAELERNGFDAVNIVPFDWLHPATPPAFIGAVRALGSVLERLPLAREFAGSVWIRARRTVGRD